MKKYVWFPASSQYCNYYPSQFSTAKAYKTPFHTQRNRSSEVNVFLMSLMKQGSSEYLNLNQSFFLMFLYLLSVACSVSQGENTYTLRFSVPKASKELR